MPPSCYNVTAMETLATLFGSYDRVKLLRFFFLHDAECFTAAEISEYLDILRTDLRWEIKELVDIGFIQEHSVKRKTKRGRTKIEKGWGYNNDFSFGYQLRGLVLNAETLNPQQILARLKGKGSYTLVVAAGIFIDSKASRADLLIVGDRLKRTQLEEAIREIETEVGQELTYSILSTKEFNYRIDMYDKFVRDVLDFPHKKLVNRFENIS